MPNTHLIELTKEKFDKIELGDRLIITSKGDSRALIIYTEESKSNPYTNVGSFPICHKVNGNTYPKCMNLVNKKYCTDGSGCYVQF